MFYEKRKYQLSPAADFTGKPLEWLAEKLTQHTWTMCTAFRRGDVLYLNDSTCEDGAAEFAAIYVPSWPVEKGSAIISGVAFESITFGWMNQQEATGILAEYDDPGSLPLSEPWCKPVKVHVDFEDHYCAACA